MNGPVRYRERFELVYRYEAAAANEVWQADHTQLDILSSMSTASGASVADRGDKHKALDFARMMALSHDAVVYEFTLTSAPRHYRRVNEDLVAILRS